VAIHDVAPATWSECLQLLRAVRVVADIPLTWLVVPRYHRDAMRSFACESTLEKLIGEGHELALHGYTHLDPVPVRGAWPQRWLRTVYTEREGEFAGISAEDARRRIALGLRWFEERGWPVSGFVAPAWLTGPAAWAVLQTQPFRYTTSYSRFYLLRPLRAQWAPALVYAARNATGRALSRPLASGMARLSAKAPLVRLALHPRDARHPALVLHAQRLLERLLVTHTAMTKQAFADRMAGLDVAFNMAASASPSPSDGCRRPRNS
jgi:predicted deacetylase